MTNLLEADVVSLAKAAGRSCGDCALCCRLLDVPEAGKPRNDWCPHCNHHGCKIYESRPQICRDYTCAWLVNKSYPDYWKPSECGMIVDFGEAEGALPALLIHVDPDTPDRWR